MSAEHMSHAKSWHEICGCFGQRNCVMLIQRTVLNVSCVEQLIEQAMHSKGSTLWGYAVCMSQGHKQRHFFWV